MCGVSGFREIERFARGEMRSEGDGLDERGNGDDAEEREESVLGEQTECRSECEVGIYAMVSSNLEKVKKATDCLCCTL